MLYLLTKHAQQVLTERGILTAWMERTLSDPELIMPDPLDPELERRYRQIPEHGGRVLRVVVNTTVDPHRVVRVFFDRTMKGKL
jgi:hypothetical protein